MPNSHEKTGAIVNIKGSVKDLQTFDIERLPHKLCS